MATEGPNQFSLAAENDLGDSPWTNPSNAVTDNDSYATNTVDPEGNPVTNAIDYTNAGLSAPGDADSVTDLTFEFACRTDAASDLVVYRVQILVAGSPTGDPVTVSLPIGTSEAYVSTGSLSVAGDFATTLTGAQVKGSGFGVRVDFTNPVGISDVVYLDAGRVTITYTAGGGGGGQPTIARLSGIPGARLSGPSFGRGW